MQPPNAVAGWDDDLNAELYARFTRDYPFYAGTSRDLAERASLPGAHLVVDLCGGTGATAALLLEILPPGARIISIDAAGAMQAPASAPSPTPGSPGSSREQKTRPGTSASPPTPWYATRRSGRPTPPPSSLRSSRLSALAAGSSSISAGPSPAFPCTHEAAPRPVPE